ncbi:MAG: alkaline phosphatase family protein [Planctomycetota bacterium]|jgi:predicted AlkP superfamily phosphohydrolase/phosphomutase
MTRTLFIGLDGATFHVLDDLTRDQPGRGPVMPFLRRFMDEGFRALLRSTPHPLTPPAWTTMVTGKGPGHHGIYDFMRTEDKGHEVFFTLYDYRDIRCETVWSIASRQKRSVTCLNFPMMAPPPPINGSLIPGFTPARHLRRNSHPKTLFDRLKERIPEFSPKELAWDFERENEIGLEMSEEYLARWISYHLPREELWYRVAETLMCEDRPDFMAVMFDGTDKIQHQAWHYIDPDLRPKGGLTPVQQELLDLCMGYFRRLDGYIEALVEQAGPDAQVYMASDHGFTATSEVLRINRYLSELGHLVYHEVADTDAARRRASSPMAYLDWSRTKAYCATPSSNGVSIRVAREPGAPGIQPEDYPAFRNQLIDELHAVENPRTGEPMIAEILLREEVFPGAAMGEAPDLTLVMRDHGFVSIRNLEPVVISRSYPAGTHHPDGIFLAGGPGIRRGVRGERLEIADVAAAFLYSQDLPIPEDFEGQVPGACFTDACLAEKPVRGGPATLPVRDVAAEPNVPEEDKQKILDQLVLLGYMED